MRRSSTLRLLALGLTLALVLTGCTRDPNVEKQKYFESGQRYFARGKYRDARIQYLNALHLDSRYADAHFQLGETYLKLRDWNSAYQELSRTLEPNPDNYHAHLHLANLLLSAH